MKANDVINVLKNKRIVPFGQSITLSKSGSHADVFFKVRMKIDDFVRKFEVYRKDMKTPLLIVGGEDEFEQKYAEMRCLPEANRKSETDFVKSIISDLSGKKIKFSVPHSYYFESEDTGYLIDSATTKERAKAVAKFLKKAGNGCHILMSHYHPDHWANNGRILAKGFHVYLHHDASDKFKWAFYIWLYTYVDEIFKIFDIKDFLQRIFKLNKPIRMIVNFIIDKMELLAKLLFIVINVKFVGIVRSGKKGFRYLTENTKEVFAFKNVTMRGWTINDELLAFETPGHSYDHLSFYIRNKNVLFSGEIDVFLNPNNSLDTPLSLIHETIDAVIDFVEAERIEVLLPSHYMPVYGTEKIVAHLQAQKEKMWLCGEAINEILLQKEVWVWSDLMARIYKSDSPIIREARSINWPKTMSNLDIYVYFLLRDNGYALTQEKEKIWEKRVLP